MTAVQGIELPAERDQDWRPIVGYETYYEINPWGDVRRTSEYATTWVGRLLVAFATPKGYRVVCLSKDGHARKFFIHRLVAEAFIGPMSEPGQQINHIDGNKSNNHFTNLEWVSPQENHTHASATGLKSHGSRHGNAKLTEQQAREIRALRGIEKQRDTAKRYGVDQAIVGRIQRGQLWRRA